VKLVKKQKTVKMFKVCVNCGAYVTDKSGRRLSKLYDEPLYKKSSILKLVECVDCNDVADRYVEYEGAIILLDLALQNTAAFRHVLLNTENTGAILKMATLTLIVDGYCRWGLLSTGREFFEQEYEFYMKCGQAACSLVVYLCVSLLVVAFMGGAKSYSQLVLGLFLAYSTRFLQLVALLWATDSTTHFMWTFIECLLLLTSARVFQVLTGWRRSSALVTMGVAYLAARLMDQSGYILDPAQEVFCN